MATNRFTKLVSIQPKTIHRERVRIRLPPVKSLNEKAKSPHSDAQNARSSIPASFNTSTRTTIVLDPIKAIEPYSKKLTNIEAKRILAVLDEVKAKCEIIIRLPHMLQDVKPYQGAISAELTELLTHHAELVERLRLSELVWRDVNGGGRSSVESKCPAARLSPRRRYQALLKQNKLSSISSKGSSYISSTVTTDSRASSDSSSKISTQEGVTIAGQQLDFSRLALQSSVRNILRAIRDDEVITQKIRSSPKSREGNFFLQCLAELRDIILDRLLIPPFEQNEKLQFMAQVVAQDKHNKLVIQQLEEELLKATTERDGELTAKNDLIMTLQHNLRNLETATEEDIRRARTEAEKQSATDQKTSDARKQKLSSELKLLTSGLSSTTGEHRDDEQALRKKKWKVESEMENWIQRYDADMGDKQDEYEQIDAVYQEELKQLRELEKRFSVLEAEYKTIMDLRLKEKEKREAAQRLFERKARSAVIIQAAWRAFKVRTITKIRAKQRKKKPKKKKK